MIALIKNFYSKYFLSITLVVFFILSVANINKSAFWRDEAFSVNTATKDVFEIITISSQDTQPPLHMLLLHISYLIFGKSGEGVFRIWSVIGAMFTIFYTIRISQKIFKEKTLHYITSLLIAFNPLIYFYSLEARSYSLLTATFTGSFYFTLKYLSKKSTLNTIFLLINLILGLYLHNLFVIGVFVIFVIIIGEKIRIKKFSSSITSIIFLSLIVFLSYIPWLLSLLQQYNTIANQGFWLSFKPESDFYRVLLSVFIGDYYISGLIPIDLLARLMSTIGLIGIIFGFINELKNFKNKFPILIMITLFPMTIFYFLSFKTPFMYIRYLFYLVPLCLILAIYGLQKIRKLLIILVISTIVFTCCTQIISFPSKEDYPSAIKTIDYRPSTDVILHKNALPVFGFRYYSDLPSYIFNSPGEVGFYEGKAGLISSDYWQGNINNYERLWVLNVYQDKDFEDKIVSLGFIKSDEKNFAGDLNLYLYVKQ